MLPVLYRSYKDSIFWLTSLSFGLLSGYVNHIDEYNRVMRCLDSKVVRFKEHKGYL